MRAARIETPRLLLRPTAEPDIEALASLWSDPEVARFLCQQPVATSDCAIRCAQLEIERSRAAGLNWWTVCIRDLALCPIGICGFRDAWGRAPEILYGIAPGYRERGYATEAVHMLVARGFAARWFDRVVGIADSGNAASIRVLEKIGMRIDASTWISDAPGVSYSVRRAEFGRSRESLETGAAGAG